MLPNRSWAWVAGAALVGAAGCLVVTPLDELPAVKADANRGGGAGRGGSGHAGTASEVGGKGEQPTAGTGGTGAIGGAPSSCQSNAECVKGNADEPYRCRPSDHTCVALRTDECPIVTGKVSDPNAVYFGAFATLDGAAPEDNPILWAHQLALNELGSDNVGGLPDGPDSMRRPLVMIVCENREGFVEPAMQHLADEVQVPAVIGTLKPGDLLRAHEDHAKRDIFYLSPVSVTSSLINEDDDGRIWNLLGQPSDFTPTYNALLKRTEAWLKSDTAWPDAAALKVALVTTGDAFDSELRDSLVEVLRFNEKSITDNGDDYFLGVDLTGTTEDLAAKAVELASFAPDVVISAASELFVMDNGLQQRVEDEWGVRAPDKKRPFYILSPYNAGDVNALMKRIGGRLEGDATAGEDQQRYVGVSIAPAADLSLQNAYGVRLRSKFKDAIVDTANYYDAIYFLAYAMYGANEPEGLTGSGITRGMKRLLDGDPFKVGPTPISATFKALGAANANIHLDSTLGLPDFDPKTGVRPVDGGVFCFKRINTTAKLVSDVLRYDRESETFKGDFSACNSDF